VDDQACYLQILDTAGQEEYVALQDTYMRAREGFIVLFDLTKKKSLYEVPRFVEKIKQVKDVNSFPLVVVGNKCDLVSERDVSEEEVKKLISEFQKQDPAWVIPYFECSAKLRTNVDETFTAMVKELRKRAKKVVVPEKRDKKCNVL
jgi:small GTP-binding protein